MVSNLPCKSVLKARLASPSLLAFCAAVLLAFASPAYAQLETNYRFYSFEEGVAGGAITSAEDTLETIFIPNTAAGGGGFISFDSFIQGSTGGGDGVPIGVPVADFINNTLDQTPSLDATLATFEPTFVDVSDGSPLDSPAPGSTLAASFSLFESAPLQGPGFRDTFVPLADFDANNVVRDGDALDNDFTVFFSVTQAWVHPQSPGQGTAQTVFANGTEFGGASITSDGFWQLTSLGPPGDITSPFPVEFDEWTHVAVVRTGGGATLFINGTTAATAPAPGDPGFLNTLGQQVTLGGDESLFSGFEGLIDNFTVGGIGDGFVAFEDVLFFSDVGAPAPTGVAGDVDQDGDADVEDYLIWSANVGFDNGFGVGGVPELLLGDLDGNGAVDFFDFFEIRSAVEAAGGGEALAAAIAGNVAVPEPSALVLLAAGALCGCRARRR